MYARLPKSLRSVATELLIRNIMSEYMVLNIADLHRALRSTEQEPHVLASEIKSNFWYKKARGEPLTHYLKISRIDQLYQETYDVLNHPFFASLAAMKPVHRYESDETSRLLLNLNNMKDNRFRWRVYDAPAITIEGLGNLFEDKEYSLNKCQMLMHCHNLATTDITKKLCGYLMKRNINHLFSGTFRETCFQYLLMALK